jgi:RNA polymerase sigma factor (sigma-70 family)
MTAMMSKLSDSALLMLARDGDKDAFGQLVERYQPMAERIALRMVAYPYIAQELAQEAILEAYLALDRLRDDTRFASWLYGITLNVCRGYLRAQKINFCSLEALAGGMFIDPALLIVATPDPLAIAEERELSRAIMQAVNTLSPAEREATLLFYYAQFRLREIATILGISEVAIKGRLHKARKQLKTQLLSLYEEQEGTRRYATRSKRMIKVSVVDAVNIMSKDASHFEYAVIVLHDEVNQRAFGIWIREAEAHAIDRGLRQSALPRPMTMNFIANILEATGATLEEVRIETLKGDVFYATARIRGGNTLHEIDARPSDAIALAVAVNAPIFVADGIFDSCALTLPAGKTLLRSDAPAEIKQEASVQAEKLTKAEYEQQFQRVLDVLTR